MCCPAVSGRQPLLPAVCGPCVDREASAVGLGALSMRSLAVSSCPAMTLAWIRWRTPTGWPTHSATWVEDTPAASQMDAGVAEIVGAPAEYGRRTRPRSAAVGTVRASPLPYPAP